MPITKEAKEMMFMSLLAGIHRIETIFKEETRDGNKILAMQFLYDLEDNLLFGADNVPYRLLDNGIWIQTEPIIPFNLDD